MPVSIRTIINSIDSIGYTGSAGPQGFTGSIGIDGPQGPQGFTGSVGPQGPQGFTGSRGPQGFSGSVGPQGFSGSVGPQGPQGFVGSLGFTGSIGAGFTGSASTVAGPQGFTGSVGSGFTGSASTALGPQGFTGSQGSGFTGSASTAVGFTGSIGTSTGFPYQYSNTITASDPGTGFFRFNSLTTGSITEMYISNLDAGGGTDRSPALLTLDDTSGSNRATIYIPGPATGFTVSITVTGTITNNGTWLTIPVTFNTGALPSNNELRNVIGVRNGDVGFTGSVGAGFTGSSGSTGFTGSAGGLLFNGYQPHRDIQLSLGQLGQGSVFLQPIEWPVDVQFDRIIYPFNVSAASNAVNFTHNLTVDVAVYTQNVSTLSQLHATRLTTQMTYANSTASLLYYGQKNISFPWTTTITAGEYVFGFRSSTATTASNGTWSNFLVSQIASSFSGMFGVHSTVVSQQRTQGLGHFSAQQASIPSTIAYSDIRGRDSSDIKSPVFYVTSGTV